MSFRKPTRASPIRSRRCHHLAAQHRRGSNAPLVLAQAAAFGVALAIGSVVAERQARSMWRAVAEDPASAALRERTVHYPGCDAARSAGVAPIYSGEPGYRPGMDGDGDGIACE